MPPPLSIPLALILAAPVMQEDRDAPYVPSPESMVAAMVAIADVRRGETWIDLGSGDGRIAIAAALAGATAIGVERDPRLAARARYKAREAGVETRVRFRGEDLYTTPVRDADIVSLYLLPDMNLRLRPRLLNEMRPGARIVSHAFDMGDWAPDRFERVDERRLYLWIVPAVVGGDWQVRLPDGTAATMSIEQRFQRVGGTLGGSVLTDATLIGDRLRFTWKGQAMAGTVGDRSITGNGWRADR